MLIPNLLSVKMPYVKKTHHDCRKSVCLLCFKKRKGLQEISEKDREIIESFFVSGLNPHDERLPTVLCITCRSMVNKAVSGDVLVSFEVYDYSTLKNLKPSTRTSSSCDCTVCLIATSNPFSPLCPSTVPPTSTTSHRKTPSPIKICPACLSHIGRGKPHNCSNSNRLDNLKNRRKTCCKHST